MEAEEMKLIPGFVLLLEEFGGVFNAQSFSIFVELMTGWVLSHRHRFITDLIVSSELGAGSQFHCHFPSKRVVIEPPIPLAGGGQSA